MGFLDRIAADNSADIDKEAEQMTSLQMKADEISKRCDEIVLEKIKSFASEMGVEAQELPRKGKVRYFLVGGLIFAVHLRFTTDEKKRSTTVPMEVLWQYAYSIVGIDVTLQPVEAGRNSSLALIEYKGIRHTINSYSNLEFEHDKVIPFLFPENEGK